MRLSAATGAVVATLRRPADVLPFYLLGAAVPAIARVLTFLGLAVAYLYLEATGRLATARAELAAVDATPPDPEAEPAAFAEWSEAIAPALDPLFSPVVAVILVGSVLATVLVAAVLSAVVSAGELAACDGRLRGGRGLTAGIVGVRRYWPRFLGLAVLELALWIAATAALVALVAVVFVPLSLLSGSVALFVVLLAVPPWLALVAVVRALFALAPVAVVVDDAGVLASLREAVRFVRRRPVAAGFYYAVALGSTLAVATLASTLAVLGVGIVISLALSIALPPALDLLKTALYADYRDVLSPPEPTAEPVRRQFVGGLRRGVRELLAFVRETPGTHLVAVASMVAGLATGWIVADPLAGAVDASIAARIDGQIPPRAAFEYFGNNWAVALVTAYSGVALAVPAIASLWFNGLFVGALARLEVDLRALLAFIAPHGVVELPAIVVSGAVGIFLGVAWWRTLRGRATRAAFADALERAFWVCVGLGVALALAAVIEGFVSPYYWRPFV
ncbi:stage II sporulation protein M [Salinilacihabitans rarus]|uniref:stage II sporulation protein M n=1 Tax=Salinilacihabitans rarus TaxID=2961596 RepID=UPI0020C93514|nr:stage II sporulation protein M [Salinilacihabitans rarus]